MGVFVAVADLRGFAPGGASPRPLAVGGDSPRRCARGAAGRPPAPAHDPIGDADGRRPRYLERARRILADVAEAGGHRAGRAHRPDRSLRPDGAQRLWPAPRRAGDVIVPRPPPGRPRRADAGRPRLQPRRRGIDAAVRIGVLEDSSQVASRVGATRRVVVASPKYLARRKRLRSPTTSPDTISSSVQPSIWRPSGASPVMSTRSGRPSCRVTSPTAPTRRSGTQSAASA